jgi:hypothetical protein
MLLPVTVVALGMLTFVNDADARHRRHGGCGCCETAAPADKPAPATAEKAAPRTERSFSVEPTPDYAPRYRSRRGTGGNAYGLDYTQRQKGYSSGRYVVTECMESRVNRSTIDTPTLAR